MGQKVSTDDYVAILEHMGRYCHHIDGGEAEAWAACFTEDGVFEGPATPGPVAGRSALTAFAKVIYENSQGGKIRHLLGNMFCEYSASRNEVNAIFYNYVTSYHGEQKGMTMALCKAVLVRNGEGWLLKNNAFTIA